MKIVHIQCILLGSIGGRDGIYHSLTLFVPDELCPAGTKDINIIKWFLFKYCLHLQNEWNVNKETMAFLSPAALTIEEEKVNKRLMLIRQWLDIYMTMHHLFGCPVKLFVNPSKLMVRYPEEKGTRYGDEVFSCKKSTIRTLHPFINELKEKAMQEGEWINLKPQARSFMRSLIKIPLSKKGAALLSRHMKTGM